MSELRYDITEEPWIACTFLDGHKENLSPIDTIRQAAEIKETDMADALSSVDSYVPQQIITMLCYAALKPSHFDKLALWDSNELPADAVEDYITRCKADGVSFDLFDEEKPFLQVPKDEYDAWLKNLVEKKEIHKPVSSIVSYMPSGQNPGFYSGGLHVHRFRIPTNGYLSSALTLSPPQYLAALVRIHMFGEALGGGYHKESMACLNALMGIPDYRNERYSIMYIEIIFLLPICHFYL